MDLYSHVLNHETTKKLEFHEIYESQISRILLDFTDKFFYGVIPYAILFFFSFSCFYFLSRLRDSMN